MNVPELIGRPTRNPWITAGGWLLLGAALVAAFAHNFVEMWLRWFPAWHRTSLGLYQRIVEGESYYTLKFCFSNEIKVPITAIPRDKLLILIDKQVGLLYCNGKFFIREIKNG